MTLCLGVKCHWRHSKRRPASLRIALLNSTVCELGRHLRGSRYGSAQMPPALLASDQLFQGVPASPPRRGVPSAGGYRSHVDDVLAVRFEEALRPAAVNRRAFFDQLDLVVGAVEQGHAHFVGVEP